MLSFGTRDANASYRHRPGAYAVILNKAGELAVIDPGGTYFLPGGGQEGSESADQALRRELLEELGVAAEETVKLFVIEEYIHSWKRDEYFRIEGTYYYVARYAVVAVPADKSHEVRWVSPEKAQSRLERHGQSWIVGEVLRRLRQSESLDSWRPSISL